MKIVVTGALGHIGSKLIRELPNHFKDVNIVMIDNMLCQRYCSLFNLPLSGSYQFHEKDVLNDNLDELIKGSDVVIHLAAITNAAGSFDQQEEVENVNYVGTKKIAESCLKANVPLINLSTTSVYGTQNEKVDEDCSEQELKPQSPYAKSKLKAERYLESLTKDGLRYVTLRFGTIFGVSEGMRFHTAINKFCWQAVMNIPLTVWTTALDQVRPYLDLDDAISALIHVIKLKIYDGQVYNVLTVNTSVRSVIEGIKISIPKLSVNYVDTEIMNQLSYDVECERFKKTNFEFHGNLNKAIKETINLIKKANE